MKQKVLVFGSNGFIGSNICELLNKHKYELFAPSSKDCDLTKSSEVEKYVKNVNPNILINAAYDGVSTTEPFSIEYMFKNMQIVANILNACRNISEIKKIIYFGSCTEYGDSKKSINENFTISPKNMYGTTKAICTLNAIEIARQYSLPLIILRPFYLYGPHDDKSVLYYVIRSIIKNEKFSVTAGGQIRDYLYVQDLAEMVLQICKKNKKVSSVEVYNLGSGKGVTLQHMFEMIFKIMKVSPKYKIREYSKHEYVRQVADTKKIKKEIKMTKFTPIDVGIKETVDWVRKQL